MNDNRNALGGGISYHTEPTLAKIVDALIDYLNAHKECHDLKEKITGIVISPLAHTITDEDMVYTKSTVMSFAASDESVPFVSFGRAIQNTNNRWYAWSNGHRVNVLDAYVEEDIQFDEIPGILDEDIGFTAEKLGLEYIPEDRAQLMAILNSIRERLYQWEG